jgi:hypothetical protein
MYGTILSEFQNFNLESAMSGASTDSIIAHCQPDIGYCLLFCGKVIGAMTRNAAGRMIIERSAGTWAQLQTGGVFRQNKKAAGLD